MVPFILLFMSATGSSLLYQLLQTRCPGVVMSGFEPFCCEHAFVETAERYQQKLAYINAVSSFPLQESPTKEALLEYRDRVSAVAHDMGKRHSRGSRDFAHVTAEQLANATAVGFKMRSVAHHFTSVDRVLQLRALLVQNNFRVVTVTRANAAKRAVSEYRRIWLGIDHLKVSADVERANRAVTVPLRVFARLLLFLRQEEKVS